jgi:hypothetical protein
MHRIHKKEKRVTNKGTRDAHAPAVDEDVSEPVALALALGRFGLGAGVASLSGITLFEDEDCFEAKCPDELA